MDKRDKTKVELEKDILNQLIKLKEVGDTYSDVIRRLLNGRGRKVQ
jgi:predicted CopG family antitoxin